MRTDLDDIVADLFHRLAEVERRQANHRRPGTVTEVDADKGLARVKLSEDPETGKPFLTPLIPWKMAAMGATKINIPPSVGQQVDVVSETGDLTDATIESSLRSDANPMPAAKPGEGHITSGQTSIFWSGDKFLVKTPHYRVEAGKVEYQKSGGGGGGGSGGGSGSGGGGPGSSPGAPIA